MLFGVADTCFTSLQGQAGLVQEQEANISLMLGALGGQINQAEHVSINLLEGRWWGTNFMVCWMSQLLT